MNWKLQIPVLVAALWWGSLTAIGFLAVPIIFAHMPKPGLAGQLAGKVFNAQTWLSLVCGMLLLLFSKKKNEPARMNWNHGVLLFVLAGMLLALLVEFAVAPRIAGIHLVLWHSLGSVMYALQWLCALIVLWKLSGANFKHEGLS